jgi:hypothetical protein
MAPERHTARVLLAAARRDFPERDLVGCVVRILEALQVQRPTAMMLDEWREILSD